MFFKQQTNSSSITYIPQCKIIEHGAYDYLKKEQTKQVGVTNDTARVWKVFTKNARGVHTDLANVHINVTIITLKKGKMTNQHDYNQWHSEGGNKNTHLRK